MLDYNVIPSTFSIYQFHKGYMYKFERSSRLLCAISVNSDRVLWNGKGIGNVRKSREESLSVNKVALEFGTYFLDHLSWNHLRSPCRWKFNIGLGESIIPKGPDYMNSRNRIRLWQPIEIHRKYVVCFKLGVCYCSTSFADRWKLSDWKNINIQCCATARVITHQ